MKMTFVSILFCFLQLNSFSQTEAVEPTVAVPYAQARYSLIIESIPTLSEPSEELTVDVTAKGVYTFRKGEGLIIPDNYTLLIEDRATGNVFDMNSPEEHAFSVNRAMIKYFVVKLRKNELSTIAALKSE